MSDNKTVASLKLEKAKFLLSEINVLMEHKFYNNVITRLYYSCFYATQALLLLQNFVPKTHKGVISLLHEHLVQTGLFDHDKAAFFSRLFNERILDDYNEFLILNEDEVIDFIQPAKDYVAYIENLFKQYQ